ncbi:hypothetical protein C8R46DRAFT_523293 [Mycena filopes]|nr:hypothetical protein C8R46DRAFT_523293 [Mycena filopes]
MALDVRNGAASNIGREVVYKGDGARCQFTHSLSSSAPGQSARLRQPPVGATQLNACSETAGSVLVRSIGSNGRELGEHVWRGAGELELQRDVFEYLPSHPIRTGVGYGSSRPTHTSHSHGLRFKASQSRRTKLHQHHHIHFPFVLLLYVQLHEQEKTFASLRQARLGAASESPARNSRSRTQTFEFTHKVEELVNSTTASKARRVEKYISCEPAASESVLKCQPKDSSIQG